MKKVYATDQERKSDQRLGCIAFPLVNGAIWMGWLVVTEGLIIDANLFALGLGAAWFVNGIIFILAFLFRPALGVGYIVSIALILVAVMMLGGLCLVSCFAGYAVALPLDIVITHVLGYLVALVLFFVGLRFFYRWAHAAYEDWWSSPPTDTPGKTRNKPD